MANKDDGKKFTTTDAGIPVASDEHSLTIGPNGPILLLIRALAACKMGLFVHPSDENTYIAASKDLEENTNLFKAASGK